jgi:hypothetical protein
VTTLDSRPAAPAAPGQIDARGPRFGAAVTVVVLAGVLLAIPSVVAVVLLAWQTLAHALGAIFGIQAQPYGVIFKRFVRPSLGAPTAFEDPQPPRFAQGVGFVFGLVGLVGLLTGATTVAYIAVGLALAAAFLNAAFEFCLGCEMYLIGKRLFGARSAS